VKCTAVAVNLSELDFTAVVRRITGHASSLFSPQRFLVVIPGTDRRRACEILGAKYSIDSLRF